MAEVTRLYQVVGFQNHVRDLPDSIAKTLFPTKMGHVDLILGIMPSGASYLLLPEDKFFRTFRRSSAKPWLSTRFKSLSPVHFSDFEAFKKKLNSFTSKKTKKGGPRDRSKVNTEYTIHGADVEGEKGIIRAGFEHQRLLYQVCRGTLAPLRDYAISPVPWLEDLRVVSFAYNLWLADTRPVYERQRDPIILDVSWTEFALPMRDRGLSAVSTTHLRVKDNFYLGNPGKKQQVFKYGESEVLTREDVAKRVQEMFVPTKEKTQSPMMVMFANERWPMDVLAALGVNTSLWHRGIEPLLRPANSTISVSLYGTGGNVKKERDRSRSPTRMQRTDRMSRRPRSPVHASTSTSSHLMPEDCVFYVDVRSMYATMKKVSLINDFVLDGALDLGVAEVNLDNNLPVDKQTKVWCAGNESRLIGHMWNAMASGNAIDEQKVDRWGSLKSGPIEEQESLPGPQHVDSEDVKEQDREEGSDEDSEVDPNDIIAEENLQVNSCAAGSSAGMGSSSGQARDPYEALEDDDW